MIDKKIKTRSLDCREARKLSGFMNIKRCIEFCFNNSDLAALCFDLNINFEDIPGETHETKVIGLIEYFCQRGILPKLLTEVRKKRPIPFEQDILPFVIEAFNKLKTKRTAKQEIMLPKDLSCLDVYHKELLVEAIRSRCSSRLGIPLETVVILDVRDGSLYITLELPRKAAVELIKILSENELESNKDFRGITLVSSEILENQDLEKDLPFLVQYFLSHSESIPNTSNERPPARKNVPTSTSVGKDSPMVLEETNPAIDIDHDTPVFDSQDKTPPGNYQPPIASEPVLAPSLSIENYPILPIKRPFAKEPLELTSQIQQRDLLFQALEQQLDSLSHINLGIPENTEFLETLLSQTDQSLQALPPELQASLLPQMATQFTRTGNTTEAFDLLNRSFELTSQIQQPDLLFQVLNQQLESMSQINLGLPENSQLLETLLGKTDQSLQFLSPDLQASLLPQMATQFTRTGNTTEAFDLLNRSAELTNQIQLPDLRFQALNQQLNSLSQINLTQPENSKFLETFLGKTDQSLQFLPMELQVSLLPRVATQFTRVGNTEAASDLNERKSILDLGIKKFIKNLFR